MYRLAVFDVDGTLVSRSARKLLPSTIEALQNLQQQGIKLAIASGRPPFAMEKALIKQIQFDYYICSNGTYLMDKDGKEWYREIIPTKDVDALRNDFKKWDDALLFQFEDKAYIYQGKKRMRFMIDHCLGRLDILADERERQQRHLISSPFAAVCFIADEHLSYYESHYPQYRFECFMENYYDIYAKQCTKASGIQHLCDTMHITMKDVICFGDALNDVAMIQQCGCGVAMGDALAEAKAVADYITTASDEDGIYLACKNLGLLKK